MDTTVAADKDMHKWGLDEREWDRLRIINSILGYFNLATSMLDAQNYPTLFAAVPTYNYLIDKLEDKAGEESTTSAEKKAIRAAIEKLKKYYALTGAAVYAISTSK